MRPEIRDLWNPDEPRYAQVAREMLETDDWVVPHLNGIVYDQKPPLYFWLVAAVSKPLGDVTEVTARLPSAVAAALVVLLTYFLGAALLGGREALLGAAITATSAQFLWMGRVGTMDSLLTLWILGALAIFYSAYSAKRPVLYLAGFVFLAPAALTKGPVGIAVPLLVMLVFLLVDVCLRAEGAKKHVAWFALAAVFGVILVAVVVGPWWYEAYQRSGGLYGSIAELSNQTQGRMFGSYSHQQPFYYYFGQILWQFLPWTVFLPLTGFMLKKKGGFRKNAHVRFLIIWFLTVFLFFTLISGKRGQYLLPLFPAVGLLLSWALIRSNPDEGRLRGRKEFSIPLLLLVILSVGALAALVAGAYLHAQQHMPTILAGGLLCLIALFVLAWLCSNRSPAMALGCVIALMTVATGLCFGYFKNLVKVTDYASARPFCDRILAEMDEDSLIFFYDFYRPNVHYYMRRRMPEFKGSNEMVADALECSPLIFLVLESKHKSALDFGTTYCDYGVNQITHGKVGGRDMICVIVYSAKTPH